MATKPTVAQVATGSKATATLWNNAVYQQWQFLDVVKPVTQLTAGTATSMANNAWTAVNFDTEVIDTDSQHSTVSNTSRVVIGTTLGWYRCSGVVTFTGSATGSRYGAKLQLNGVDVNGAQNLYANYSASVQQTASLATIYVQSILSTDYVELLGFQASGGAMNTVVVSALRSCFSVEYMGTLQ
jgi:hypothetical protein